MNSESNSQSPTQLNHNTNTQSRGTTAPPQSRKRPHSRTFATHIRILSLLSTTKMMALASLKYFSHRDRYRPWCYPHTRTHAAATKQATTQSTHWRLAAVAQEEGDVRNAGGAVEVLGRARALGWTTHVPHHSCQTPRTPGPLFESAPR